MVTRSPSSIANAAGAPSLDSASVLDHAALFVVWPKGRHAEDRILADLRSRFQLLRLCEVEWSTGRVMENYRRFYSDIPVRGVYHSHAKGRGPFLAAVVLDRDPRVTERMTSRGRRILNARFLDAKLEYRRWAGELTVHSTEIPFETERDLTMLFGVDSDRSSRLASLAWSEEPVRLERIRRDLTGAGGWSSERELFEVLERSVRYVLMGVPTGASESDILHHPGVQILTDDYLTLHAALDARPRLPWPNGGRSRLRVAGRWVEVDLRYVGDGTLDVPGAERLLEARERGPAGRWYLPDTEPRFATGAFEPGGLRESARPGDRHEDSERSAGRGYRLRHQARDVWGRVRDQILFRVPAIRRLGRLRPVRVARWLKSWLPTGAGFYARRGALLLRGILFLGRRYRCPCCGWSLRAFAGQWSLLGTAADGYCPRCNAKARHRRLWLHLRDRTDLLRAGGRVLEVAPWWSISRRLRGAAHIEFVGLDLEASGPHVTVVGDAQSIPLAADCIDSALCIHTLEHIEDDRKTIQELHRVLRPGGWAVISVPLNLEAPTHEDPSITDPEERAREFGERTHVRLYGLDLRNRLQEGGFRVEIDWAEDVPQETRRRFGLRTDENLFLCEKPVTGS